MTSVNPVPLADARPGKRDRADPCTLVIFGATGDLTRRMLIPALYYLAQRRLLAEEFAILGIGRQAMEHAAFRKQMRAALDTAGDIQAVDESAWKWLEERTFFCAADITDAAAYGAIVQTLETIESTRSHNNRLFYLAIPPSVFGDSVRNLSGSGVARCTPDDAARPWVRLVVEKPFGHSLASAQELNATILERFGEHQVFRIDHYLGKETVQNLLVFRFANSIFEPLWNRHYVERVEITAAEAIGVENRGKYYEETGVIRDMFQNHLLQLLTLAAMEPPTGFAADAVRDEKVKVLRSIRPLVENRRVQAVRAQYAAGTVDGKKTPAYRDEPDVSRASTVPTFAAVRISIDNWRWQGVPFLVRSGKRLARRASEILVRFRPPPHLASGPVASGPPNSLVIRVQPDEGIAIRMDVKTPGTVHELTPHLEMTPVEMDFCYSRVFGEAPSPAYETLLLDTMIGDATLFARSDEVEMAWRVIDPLIQHWENTPVADMATYPPGSWGPPEADELLRES